MTRRLTGAALDQLRLLFNHGTVGGLSDGELLDRFVGEGDEGAFAALVDRHGPMVLRLCRQVIRDEHEAQDAAQAVFLVLARRAGSIRRRGSLASWLYRVARRIAVRARVVAARRRETEWRGASTVLYSSENAASGLDHAELYEELDRLPERYRAPLVLCYLQGLTHEQAAQRLQCPVRTVETRLLRGRARLRERLIRRGIVPSAVLAQSAGTAPAMLPPSWTAATIQAGTAFNGSHAAVVGMVSARAVALTKGTLNAMFFEKLGLAASSLLILSGAAAGGATWARQAASHRPSNPPAATVPQRAELARAQVSKRGAPSNQPAPPQTKKKRAGGGDRELSHDDGHMTGRKSIAGGGHAVRFEAPGEGWTLSAVRIHGARYGYPRPPRENFKIFLCDEKFHQIAEFAFPYSKFERGKAKWITLEVKPTKVPKTFFIGANFDPTRTKGIYLSHDKEGSGSSMVGLPDDEHQPFKTGDWLIRAKLQPPKETAPKSDAPGAA